MNKLAHLVVPFLLPAAGFAQAAAKSPPKEPFVIEAGEVKLQALIDRCATYLDCNILWDAREMEDSRVQPLRLQKVISTDQDGCLEFLASSLYRGGFGLTWADEKMRRLEAISMTGPRSREVQARATSRDEKDVLARPNLLMPVAVVVPLQHVNALVATNSLRPFFAAVGPGGGGVTIGVMGGNNAMVLTGMQDRVAQAIGMIHELDRAPPGDAERIPDAGKRIETLQKRVAELETQVKILTDKLAEAVKNRK